MNRTIKKLIHDLATVQAGRAIQVRGEKSPVQRAMLIGQLFEKEFVKERDKRIDFYNKRWKKGNTTLRAKLLIDWADKYDTLRTEMSNDVFRNLALKAPTW